MSSTTSAANPRYLVICHDCEKMHSVDGPLPNFEIGIVCMGCFHKLLDNCTILAVDDFGIFFKNETKDEAKEETKEDDELK